MEWGVIGRGVSLGCWEDTAVAVGVGAAVGGAAVDGAAVAVAVAVVWVGLLRGMTVVLVVNVVGAVVTVVIAGVTTTASAPSVGLGGGVR